MDKHIVKVFERLTEDYREQAEPAPQEQKNKQALTFEEILVKQCDRLLGITDQVFSLFGCVPQLNSQGDLLLLWRGRTKIQLATWFADCPAGGRAQDPPAISTVIVTLPADHLIGSHLDKDWGTNREWSIRGPNGSLLGELYIGADAEHFPVGSWREFDEQLRVLYNTLLDCPRPFLEQLCSKLSPR